MLHARHAHRQTPSLGRAAAPCHDAQPWPHRSPRHRIRPCTPPGITDFLPSPAGAGHTVRVCCLPSKQLAALGPIHISPDIYSDWPYTLREMLAWAFEPADQGMLEELVERGRADARAWAAATGVGALAAQAAAGAVPGGAGAVAAGAARGAAGGGGSGRGLVLP